MTDYTTKNDAIRETREDLDENEDAPDFWDVAKKYDTTGEKALEGWEGEGWYYISYSDGGMRVTSEGPIWCEDVNDLAGLISMVNTDRTETHLPVVEFDGNGDDPEVRYLGIITKVDWRPYRGKCDLIVGGSPCQSFSIAGKREGLNGSSGLMWEYVRAISEVCPQ